MIWVPRVGDVVYAPDYTGEHHVALLIKVVELSSGAVGFRVRFAPGRTRTFTALQDSDITLISRAKTREVR